MTLRRFRVYVPDKDAWLSPNDCYLCSEVDPLLKEARELIERSWLRHEPDEPDAPVLKWQKRRDAFLKATETKP